MSKGRKCSIFTDTSKPTFVDISTHQGFRGFESIHCSLKNNLKCPSAISLQKLPVFFAYFTDHRPKKHHLRGATKTQLPIKQKIDCKDEQNCKKKDSLVSKREKKIYFKPSNFSSSSFSRCFAEESYLYIFSRS